jgi:hypothetical protein
MQRFDMRACTSWLKRGERFFILLVLLLNVWGCQAKGPAVVSVGQPGGEWAPGQVLDARSGRAVSMEKWLEIKSHCFRIKCHCFGENKS